MRGVKVVDRARATRHRILEIHSAARVLTDAGKQRMNDSYGKLVAIKRGVVRQAETVVSKLARGKFVLTGKLPYNASAGVGNRCCERLN